MVEHEWQQGDAVWWLPDFGEEWWPGTIQQPNAESRCARVSGAASGQNFWAGYSDLRPRDPALDGDDKPSSP